MPYNAKSFVDKGVAVLMFDSRCMAARDCQMGAGNISGNSVRITVENNGFSIKYAKFGFRGAVYNQL